MKRTVILVIVMMCVAGSAAKCQISDPPDYNDADAYDVYSAVLSLPFKGNLFKSKILIIREETLMNFGAYVDQKPDTSTCLQPTDEFKPVVQPAIDDYLEKNRMKWRLQNKFDLNIPYKLVSSETVLDLIKRDGWPGFYKTYPDSGSFIDLSAVGFNSDRTIAVVTKGGWCGELCGEGSYYVMQKKEGRWTEFNWQGRKCHWVS
jgi:hypothetical protein